MNSRFIRWLLARRSGDLDPALDKLSGIQFPDWAQPADQWVLIRQDLAFAELATRIVAWTYGLAPTGDLGGLAARGVRKTLAWPPWEAGFAFNPHYEVNRRFHYGLYFRRLHLIAVPTLQGEDFVRWYEPEELQEIPSLVDELAGVIGYGAS